MLLYCLLFCIVSDGNLCFSVFNVSFFLWLPLRLSLIFSFQQLIMVHPSESICLLIYLWCLSYWSSLSFLCLWIIDFHYFCKILSHHFSNISFPLLSLSFCFPLWDFIHLDVRSLHAASYHSYACSISFPTLFFALHVSSNNIYQSVSKFTDYFLSSGQPVNQPIKGIFSSLITWFLFLVFTFDHFILFLK